MRAVEERLRVRILSEVGGVLDVEVKAAGEDVAFCPPSTEDADAERIRSATEVEGAARRVLEAHAEVESVVGVTVHYQGTALVRVDANIRVDPSATVSDANALAAKLRTILEESGNDIDQANIFLDLNADAPSVKMKETVLSK